MAVRFDAATDRCTWTGTAPTPSSGLTITYWCYIVVDRDDFSTMIRLHSSSGATTNLNVATDSGGVLPCVFTTGGTSTGPQALVVGAWARVAVTVNGTASTVYVAQGAGGATQSQVGTVGSNAAVSPNSGYTVGGRAPGDSSEWLNGRLAYLRIWSTVLTQAQIETEWASPTPVRTANLFADYPLLSATDLTDHSGNTRHLTAGTTAVTTEADPPVATTINATVAATMPPLAATVAGQATTTGQLASTLPTLTGTFAATATTAGQLAATLPALTFAATGTATAGGQLAATLPAVAAALAGAGVTAGQVAATLPAPGLAAAGGVEFAGQLGAVLPALDTELAGVPTVAGGAAYTLPALTAALAGSLVSPVAATLTVTLPGLTMASGRVPWPPAVDDAPRAAAYSVSEPEEVPWIAVS